MPTRLTAADAWLRRWVPSGRARAAIGFVFVASAALQIVGVPFTDSFGTRHRIDLDVYRLGAQIWQHGQSLYADGSMPFTSDGIWLPFTYPPFAALAFVPLGAIGLTVAGIAMSVLTVVLTALIVHITLTQLDVGSDRNRPWLSIATTAAALWINPMWMTLGFGQVNIILMALIMVDLFVLGRGRWAAAAPFQGALVGLAAAIKLTPLVFIVVFLASRRWRAAATAIGTFVGAGVLAWVWLPADSIRYWTHTLFHTTRIGDPAGRINQNLNAFWIRVVPGSPTQQQLLWVVSSILVTVLAIAAVRACRPRAGFARHAAPAERTSALLATGVVAIWGLLVSPTSWAHHWVWSIPIVLTTMTVAARSAERRIQVAYLALATSGILVFLLGPFQFLSSYVRQWDVIDHLVGNAYSLWGIAVLLVVWRLPVPGQRPPPVTGQVAATSAVGSA